MFPAFSNIGKKKLNKNIYKSIENYTFLSELNGQADMSITVKNERFFLFRSHNMVLPLQ